MKKLRKLTALLSMCLLCISLCACQKDAAQPGYEPDGQSYEDAASNGDEELYDGETPHEDAEPAGSAPPVADEPLTEARANEIYAVFQSRSYETYRAIENSAEAWNACSDAEKTRVFEDFSAMAQGLGFPVGVTESQWSEAMASNVGYYTYDWSAFLSLSLEIHGPRDLEYYADIYRYVRGVKDGKYPPLHPEILATADDITVEYRTGEYLLCVGAAHSIMEATKAWTTMDSFFYQSGSVTPIADSPDAMAYSIGGEDGKMQSATFAETDFMPVFRDIGALAQDGSLQNEMLQICAIDASRAPVLYVLTQDASGLITVAVVRYDQSGGGYIWNGEMLTTKERCCFNDEDVFCYIDESETLQQIGSAD